jgi:hypothetical protein
MSDNRDVLERAQTALENTADYEKRHGAGINLAPIISDLMAEVRSLRAAFSSSLIACTMPGCDDAGGTCDDVRECGNAYPRQMT